jgi:hypothetical protein
MSDAFAIWFWRPMFEFLGTVALFVIFIGLWIIGDWAYYNVIKPIRNWYKGKKDV